MSSNIAVRLLTAPSDDDRARILDILEAAFHADNLILCLTGASRTAERFLYQRIIDVCLRDGEVWVAGFGGRIDAVALWIRPGRDYLIGADDEYRRTLPDEMQDWYLQHMRPKYQELYAATYAKGSQTRVQAWHLKLMAVHPQRQRQRLGKSLMSTLLDKADRSSLTLTTDVQTSSALHFFQALGFKYTGVKNFISRRAGFPLWSMLRQPSSSSTPASR
ncbi:acyl-CoA N-acyltransferase [Auriscalpium vulgare]|uniref:Acyl-CoA N-acyltransferase n=1 Tax=Auriscalpium vulgare TaxID=40419 RepID=A0ACB8RZ31_9AGAM|nr:acyl-CoA N-acyltransferase [Auriscalpium vulgare]